MWEVSPFSLCCPTAHAEQAFMPSAHVDNLVFLQDTMSISANIALHGALSPHIFLLFEDQGCTIQCPTWKINPQAVWYS